MHTVTYAVFQLSGVSTCACKGKRGCVRCGGEHEYRCEEGVRPKCKRTASNAWIDKIKLISFVARVINATSEIKWKDMRNEFSVQPSQEISRVG